MMLYSNDLARYEGELPSVVREGIRDIQVYFAMENVSVLKYSDWEIAIPVKYNVSLPMRGAIGVDIREQEPMLIVIWLSRFPDMMPDIKHDRKDFPRQYLPHLYGAKTGKPASLCLVRHGPNEWFANKRMQDFLNLGAVWLYKAANGLLLEDNNEFDPTRLRNASGQHIYQYSALNKLVLSNNEFKPGCGYALLFTSIEKGENGQNYQSLSPVTFAEIRTVIDFLTKKDEELEKAEIKLLFTIVVWNKDKVEDEYNTIFPESYGELKKYFRHRELDFGSVMWDYLKSGYQLRNGIPVIYAVRRPKKLIGYAGNFEFFNFWLDGSKTMDHTLPDDAEVTLQQHAEPFSPEMAETLSGEKREAKTLFIGGGSLGSKVISHDGRGGKRTIGVIDDDDFMKHNLARHILFTNAVGRNKATAVVDELNSMFRGADLSGLKAYPFNLIGLDSEEFERYDWLVDCTAGKQAANFLVNQDLPETLTLAKCELVNDGKLGLLYIEGADRNPRLDDLTNLTHYLATRNQLIEAWRRTDEKRELKTLDIGQGCSSATSVMPDDVISFHASLFSKTLLRLENRAMIGSNGFLFRSVLEGEIVPTIETEFDVVKPFEVYHCRCGSGWNVRMLNGLSAKFLALCRKNSRRETGGAVVGVANYKTKTIHIFEIIAEPKGSKGAFTWFVRGSIGLPEQIDRIKAKTGQVIGYIGEWHTHPMSLEALSATDLSTIQRLLPLNRTVPIPTLSIVVTPDKILPFVVE